MNEFDKVSRTAHAVVESSMLKATTVGHHYSVVCTKDVDNGTICTLGEYLEDMVFEFADYAPQSKMPLMIITPPHGDALGRQGASEDKYFYNAAGEVARAYMLYLGDIFTISDDAFAGTPAVGKYINANYEVLEGKPSFGFAAKILSKVFHSDGTCSYRLFIEQIA